MICIPFDPLQLLDHPHYYTPVLKCAAQYFVCVCYIWAEMYVQLK